MQFEYWYSGWADIRNTTNHFTTMLIRIRERMVIRDYVEEAGHLSEAHQIYTYNYWRSWAPYYEEHLLSMCRELLPRIHLRPINGISANIEGYVSVAYLKKRYSGGLYDKVKHIINHPNCWSKKLTKKSKNYEKNYVIYCTFNWCLFRHIII